MKLKAYIKKILSSMEGNAVTIDFEVKLNDQGDVDDNGEQTINVRAYLR